MSTQPIISHDDPKTWTPNRHIEHLRSLMGQPMEMVRWAGRVWGGGWSLWPWHAQDIIRHHAPWCDGFDLTIDQMRIGMGCDVLRSWYFGVKSRWWDDTDIGWTPGDLTTPCLETKFEVTWPEPGPLNGYMSFAWAPFRSVSMVTADVAPGRLLPPGLVKHLQDYDKQLHGILAADWRAGLRPNDAIDAAIYRQLFGE